MTTVAYIANEFPSPLEPYVIDEIRELRRRGTQVICCSGKRVAPRDLTLSERALWKETRYFQPLSDDELLRALKRLGSNRRQLTHFLKPLVWERGSSLSLRLRGLCHTLMGASMAEFLAPQSVEHIHAHHGYFASWMALVAARLLGIGFSFTLHGSDLLQRGDLLSAKLCECQFCVTVSDYNKHYILRNYPATRPEKIIVQRLGVDPVVEKVESASPADEHRFSVLSIGRLHPVKNHRFLIEACSALRDRGLDFVCSILGDGPERTALQRQIAAANLQKQVQLKGHVPRAELSSYYAQSDLVILTSKSEGIPVVLMEAMAHGKLVLAPAITGIPELVDDQQTGFLYQAGSLSDFVKRVLQIHSNQSSLAGVQRAAAARVASSYNRQQNMNIFAEQFLARISRLDNSYAYSLLQ